MGITLHKIVGQHLILTRGVNGNYTTTVYPVYGSKPNMEVVVEKRPNQVARQAKRTHAELVKKYGLIH